MKSIRKSPVMMCLEADASAERRVGKSYVARVPLEQARGIVG